MRYLQGIITGFLLLLLVITGCSQKDSFDIVLQLQVQPSGRQGIYQVTGTTNLPNDSRITVVATRSLLPTDPDLTNSRSEPFQAILSRQIAEVKEGQWQTTLNLWEVAPDGHIQEPWQLEQPQIGVELTPSSEVHFRALVEPKNQPPALAETLVAQKRNLQSSLIRLMDDDQWYLQASQTLSIALPTGKTNPPVIKAEATNWGWGEKRYEIQEQSLSSVKSQIPPATTPQTNAPLAPVEFLR